MASSLLTQNWVTYADRKLPQAISNGTLHVTQDGKRLVHVGGATAGAVNGIPEVYTTKLQGDGVPQGWRIAGSLPKGTAFHESVLTDNGWLYVLNGTTNAPTTPMYAVKIDNDGNFVGTVKDLGSIDIGLSTPAMVLNGQWLYVIGGDDAVATVIANPNLTRVGAVVTATIATGHNFVPGQQVTLTPGEADFATGVKTITQVTKTTFSYAEAGNAVSSTAPETFTAKGNNRVRVVRLNGDGSIGNWRTLSDSPLPVMNYFADACIANGYVYLFGGTDDLAAGAQAGVYSASILTNGDLGRWTKVADLPIAVSKHAVVQWRDKVLIMGGQDAASANRAEIWTAQLLPSGSITGIQTDVQSLPVALRNVRAVLAGNRIYLVSGFAGARIDDVYSLRVD